MSNSFDLGKAAAMSILNAAESDHAGADFMHGVVSAYAKALGVYADVALQRDLKAAAKRMGAERAQSNAYQGYGASDGFAGYGNAFNANAYQRAQQREGRKPHPEPTDNHWSKVLGVPPTATKHEIKAAYRTKAKVSHSDAGGSDELMRELTAARDAALRECAQ